MKIHSCWNRWQLVHRPSSEASKPEQRICNLSAHVPRYNHWFCLLYVSDSIDMRSQSAASVPADSHTYGEEGHAWDLEDAHRTCRKEEGGGSRPALDVGVVVE